MRTPPTCAATRKKRASFGGDQQEGWKPAALRALGIAAVLQVVLLGSNGVAALAEGQKYGTRVVRTRYGALRGIVARVAAVEAYLGVPYATPPAGALRYMPPVTPTPWRGTRVADSMPPACPQRPPRPEDAQSARRRAYLQKITPILTNHSEDCLYLNLYVPRTPHGNPTDLLPALLLVHGDSYSWGAGNSLDGTALAAQGRLIVVSINFRLGVLGFLKTGSKASAQGNFGLMDLVAGLHWLRENLAAFGGDPERITLLGHGTGAALANLLAVSPMASELVQRVVLLGGSALSSWAIQRDPLSVKRRVAEQSECSGDVETDDIAPCLRLRSLEQLLDVRLDPPRFTSGFAPFVDGAVLPIAAHQTFQPTAASSGLISVIPGPGAEYAAFGQRDLLMGLTSGEAWLDLTDEDFQKGLNETRRDRILRTYVRNTYRYHLHEIYSTLRNEYTDWERGEQSPSVICEGLLSLLGDGQVAAPLLRLALLHSSGGGRGYFFHFQPGERVSLKGDELPYLLGVPLLRGEPTASALATRTNFTTADETLSRLLVHYLANFVRRGKFALVIILTRAGLDLDPEALKRLRITVPKIGLIPWVVEAGVMAVASKYFMGLPWVWGLLLGSIIAAVSPAVVVPCLFRLRVKGYGVAKGIPTLVIAIAGVDDAASVAIFGIIKSIMFSNDALWYQILQGPISICGGIGFGILWGFLAKYVPEKNDPYMVPLRILMLLGGGLIAVLGSEAIELGGAGPLGVVAAAFVSCYFWQKDGWEVEDNPVATAFEIFWMIFEPILFGITGTQIKINELNGTTVYLGIGVLVAGIVIRILVTLVVSIGSNLNMKEKVFVSLSLMAKATVQAALGPTPLEQVSADDAEQTEYGETVLMLCILSILITAPIGAIIITLTGPRLLTKTRAAEQPEEWNRIRRPSMRDISIINEEIDMEEEDAAEETKP
ncbi:neuroligin-1 isoform X1 [Neodiprion lecontei]|uniref:Neuroligin-1 isoform X1 n=1 Tax=Neodiprion lecontei TaxID=441921 RepID=A0ABM3FGW2_NEOLC|nr:neuroligin-1-like isoform X1 [Neodiprion fabricii]XP_046467974.1 neuroligin-1-like isoform X1 [Neodiprion pinetum]XP_046587257.1 neuroligin-1 isoform X1 [Neodiprion lecontei]